MLLILKAVRKAILHQNWGYFQIYLKGSLLAQVISGRATAWESSDHQIPQISQPNSRIGPCFYKKHSKGPFSTCLYQKENNVFLASNTCSGLRVLDNLDFLTTVPQGRIFFIKQHGEMRSKLFGQELSGIKHTKKLSKEVCAEHTEPGMKGFWRWMDPSQMERGQKCCPRSHNTVHHNAVPLPALGKHVFTAGSKAGEPWE